VRSSDARRTCAPDGSRSWSSDVTVLADRAPATPTRSVRRFLAWHPQWWVYAVAAIAWLVLLVMSAQMSMPMEHHTASTSWAERWTHWLLMVLAMMLLVSARQVRVVALRSLWSRRQRSAVCFALGYAALWALVGAVLVTIVITTGLDGATDLVVVSLLLAAAWQVSAPRRRLVRRCEALRLGAPSGLAGDVDCARAGVRAGVRCLQEGWPAMIAMALSQSLLLMVGLTVVLLTERMRGANPERRAGRPLEAWVLAGFAVVAALAAVT
jgi:hypothetical protein